MSNENTGEKPAIDKKWEFGGTKYEQFVANRTGHVGIPIMHPVNKEKKVAILGADFLWTDDQVFIDHQNLKLRDEKTSREEESVRRRANLVTQNATLFDETVQGGWLQKIDEFGNVSEPIIKTRDQMLDYPPEIQSDLIDAWLGYVFIERYMPPGMDEVDMFLTEPDSVFFTLKVGDYKSPAHVLLFEFNTPSPEARRSYETDTVLAGSKQEGDRMITSYMINNYAKMRFARKHFKDVKGVVLAPEGEVELSDWNSVQLFDPKNDKAVADFRNMFNPVWWMRLADSVADIFDFGGK